MAFGNKTPDATLLKNVLRKLTQKCTSATRIGATVRGGAATVTGTIKYEHERNQSFAVSRQYKALDA
jgi:hypothetical protein